MKRNFSGNMPMDSRPPALTTKEPSAENRILHEAQTSCQAILKAPRFHDKFGIKDQKMIASNGGLGVA